MERTFADTLQSLSKYFPESLVSATEFGKMVSIGTHFPSLMSMGAAFETRLSKTHPQLDLFFAINKDNRSVLADSLPRSLLNPALFSHPVWQQIRVLFNVWNVSGSDLDSSVNQVFLEFDLDGVTPDIPVPAVFMQISDTFYLKDPDLPQNSFKDAQDLETGWIFKALSILKNGSISSGALAKTRQCFDNLLPGTCIDHIAIMASRTPDAIRINVNGLGLEQLYNYLESIGLGSRTTQLRNVLPGLYKLVDHLVLAIDISDSFSPRIGIELRFPKGERSIYNETKWELLLDKLVSLGLCIEGKKEGLMKWGGKSRELFDPELCRFMIFRHLDLIKLVFKPDLPPSAKAYFSFIIQPFSSP
jgi:hypothetical protein